MSTIFDADWMAGFKEVWNNEPELSGELEKIGFNSIIGYGFEGEDQPRGVLTVENGNATDAGAYTGQTLNWDLRAAQSTWEGWMSKPPGMMGLGAAYTTGKIKFLVGDYAAMIKDPRMAGPFIKSFQIMAQV